MNVLVTGAFGNIGAKTIPRLLERGHHVRAFDLENACNRRLARRLDKRVEMCWGDIRLPADLKHAVEGVDAVVHLAFVIPRLSATGINSEDDPVWARHINVGGTQNVIEALQAQPAPARLLFASSLHVYGRTQDREPPRTLQDPLDPIEHYAHHKVECERMVRESGLTWAIFRLAAAVPTRLILDPGVFDVPLTNRIEIVHPSDVAEAIANALETEKVWGRLWLIGGGLRCQMIYREFVTAVLNTVGLGMLPDPAFTTVPFGIDWLDTAESQAVLHYQLRTLQDYLRDTVRSLGWRRPFIVLLRPWLRRRLLSFSPVLQQLKAAHGAAAV